MLSTDADLWRMYALARTILLSPCKLKPLLCVPPCVADLFDRKRPEWQRMHLGRHSAKQLQLSRYDLGMMHNACYSSKNQASIASQVVVRGVLVARTSLRIKSCVVFSFQISLWRHRFPLTDLDECVQLSDSYSADLLALPQLSCLQFTRNTSSITPTRTT